MRTVILITGHYLHSKRRAGFHWIADALHRQGWRVIMMTTPISWLSWLKRDHRFQYNIFSKTGRIIWDNDRLGSFIWWTRAHPVTLKYAALNKLAAPMFRQFEKQPLGAIEEEVRNADCFIFESTAALTLADRFRALNPNSRIVYRVSDDLRTLRVHPSLHEREMQLAPLFDRISSPTVTIHEKFAEFKTAAMDPHGVPVHLYEQCKQNPYDGESHANCVFTGVARLDTWFLNIVSAARPKINLHIIGPFEKKLQRANVHYHGEQPFEETIFYVKFADVGLQTIIDGPGAESFADSLKVQQYSWCKLPILAPDFLSSERPNVVSYHPGDEASALTAMDNAVAMQHRDEWRNGVSSWDDIALRLVGEPVIDTNGEAAIEVVNQRAAAANRS